MTSGGSILTRALTFATVTALSLLIGAVHRPVDVRPALALGQSVQRVLPNDNRSPAGRMERDTLVLRLTVTPADWRQQYGGLVGGLVVLEPGERLDPAHDLFFLISDGVPRKVFINGSLDPPPRELQVGRTYRLRFADIAVYRLSLLVSLLRDSTLMAWRPIAKDGFTLPPSQATMRPSVVNLPPGETADFEFTPDRPGEVALEIGPQGQPVQGRLVFRVRQ